jgi:hypothetical protein
VDVRNALLVASDKLRNYAFSSKSTKYDDANVTSSHITESTPSRQVKISSTSYNSTKNFPMIDHGPSLNQMDSVENSFHSFHLGSPGSSEIEVMYYTMLCLCAYVWFNYCLYHFQDFCPL